jgi:eight-cysteine-cluster-containing protein
MTKMWFLSVILTIVLVFAACEFETPTEILETACNTSAECLPQDCEDCVTGCEDNKCVTYDYKVSEIDRLSCWTDDDCVCQGFDKITNKCFLGNKNYYNKYVDKEATCSDFCGGFAGNLAVQCVKSRCIQVEVKEIDGTASTECTKSSDCEVGGCSAELCQKAGTKSFTTCEYKEEYDCTKASSCSCTAGKCAWEETQAFVTCLAGIDGTTIVT